MGNKKLCAGGGMKEGGEGEEPKQCSLINIVFANTINFPH